MSSLAPPFDDSVQLETMEAAEYFSDSDTAPIVWNENEISERDLAENVPASTVIIADHRMDESGAPLKGKTKAYVTIATLLLINLLNYMDRFTVAGKYHKCITIALSLIEYVVRASTFDTSDSQLE